MRFLPRWQLLTVQYSHAHLIRNTFESGVARRPALLESHAQKSKKEQFKVHTKQKHTNMHTVTWLQTKARTHGSPGQTDPHELTAKIHAYIMLAQIRLSRPF